jgi:hypothetical protein
MKEQIVYERSIKIVQIAGQNGPAFVPEEQRQGLKARQKASFKQKRNSLKRSASI